MSRLAALLYGIFCYLVFVGAFLYLIWFIRTLDRPRPAAPLAEALLINTALILLFAIQHSAMARQGFKRAWTRIVPQPVERSTYVLFASLVLLALFTLWQPMPQPVWSFTAPWLRLPLDLLFWCGWFLVFISTWIIDHYGLFGLRQVWCYFRQKPFHPPAFKVPGPYRFVRHPLYLGFLISLWSTPVMTLGHLYFSGVSTLYILLAVRFEERDLIRLYGEDYQRYRSGVSMLVPWSGSRK